ncbi:MAG: formylmethanofuran dehydrogenase [Chloroflexi bacterium]|nr:MAG: formylmethanofuran dehydrogenase [Chloroflexota bacterium]
MTDLQTLLKQSAALHNHLCPRQVLGVRMGLAAGRYLGIEVPQSDKRIFTIVETDGCATDGVAVAVNCWVGRRSMYVFDFGKVAATFVDTHTGRAVRIVPSAQSRQLAQQYAPEAESRWHGYLLGYQRMPDDELLTIQEVSLTVSVQSLISRDGYRVNCDICGEEIINEREIRREGLTLCRACAGARYYALPDEATAAVRTVSACLDALEDILRE